MKNYIQKGDNITIASPGTVASGDVVLVGALFGIAAGDAEIGDDLDIVTRGVFDMPKHSTDAYDAGVPLYRDLSDGEINDDDSNPFVAVAVEDAANPSSTVKARLIGFAYAIPSGA